MHLSPAVKRTIIVFAFALCSLVSLAARADTDGQEKIPPSMSDLENVNRFGASLETSDLLDSSATLNLRRDAMKEAAMSYGARGGLARRGFEIMRSLSGHEDALDQVFDFNRLLIQAPSGMLIEPPVIGESQDALVIEDAGVEAAVADRVYNISKEAKIVTAARNWRNYLIMTWETVDPPPKILWPKSPEEQKAWQGWVRQGWEEGYKQADEIFQINVDRMVADFNGMVRYRMLLTQGMVSAPFALHEDRGITGGGAEMRVGDRAIRITGPSQLQTGAEQWMPADR